MQKRKIKKIKNIILMGSVIVALFVFLTSACAVDSDSWIPFVVAMISFGYMALFAKANGMTGE